MSAKTNDPAKTPETALRSLQNFCAAYTFRASYVQLNRALSMIIEGNYSDMTYSEKAELFDYFIALEDLMPALYELLEYLDKPIRDEDMYSDEVSAKDMYASFKRHPE